MNISLVISSLAAGGAERVISLLANYWAEKGWCVTILNFDDGSTPPFFPLHGSVKIIPLNLLGYSRTPIHSVVNNVKRTLKIRRAIKQSQAQAVICFIDTANIRTLLATRGLDIPVIISERTDPSQHQIGRAWNWLRKIVYPWADTIVLQSHGAMNFFPSTIRKKARVIPNPVMVPTVNSDPECMLKQPVIVAVGRLAQEKGHALLVEAFAKVAAAYPDWQLALIGDGPERERLTQLVCDLGLSERVHFTGWADNVYDCLNQADIFVQSSLYEGFPNALCEAMASGVPAISTNCNGVSTILEDGKCGLIVPCGDAQALAASLDTLMGSQELRASMSRKGIETMKRFSIEKIMRMWEGVIQDVL